MSKYNIENGIWKTPVFHGDSYFFIERQEFKEVKEVKGSEYIYNIPLWMVQQRRWIDKPCSEIKSSTDYALSRGDTDSGVYLNQVNELILRN